jgi:hypothetical protein
VLPTDSYPLLFPALLLVVYVFCWLRVGRDPRIKNVSPQYEPPAGVSPGVARYIRTGGSDGTTLAAVAASLAARGVLAIQPVEGKYRLDLLDPRRPVLPEEAALVKSLFQVEVPVDPYRAAPAVGAAAPAAPPPATTTTSGGAALGLGPATDHAEIDPALASGIIEPLNAIQETFRKNLTGVYFRDHRGYALAGILATFVWGMGTALFLEAQSSIFLTFWLLMFTTLAGLVIGGYWTAKPTHPTPSQRFGRILMPVLFFVLPGAVIYFAALPENHGFVLALLLSVLVNNVFFVIMRAPTPLGLETLRQLAGFREFLVRVEQDRLDRLNSSAERAALMNRFLPYAIALEVREGWGDSMAAALSDKIVER